MVAACAGSALAGPNSEVEPNNLLPGVAPSAGTALSPGGAIQGSITPGDTDFIRVTVPAVEPSGSLAATRRVFEVSATGDVTLDLIEPSTGRILASSDDAPDGVAGGGPGSARCAFEMLEPESVATEWTLAVRGFWPDAQFDYEVRYAVEPVTLASAITVQPAVQSYVIDSIEPAQSRWYALTLNDAGWLRITVQPSGMLPPDLAFTVLDASGQCLAFLDDIHDASIDYWQSPDSTLLGTVYVVVAPVSMRTPLGVLPPEPGSTPLTLWDRQGVGLGERAGWLYIAEPGGFARVPGGSFRIDFEYGLPPQPCLADIDQNGGIDGGDLAAFFELFEAGDSAADLDFNGGVDGGDLAVFFEHFESGC